MTDILCSFIVYIVYDPKFLNLHITNKVVSDDSCVCVRVRVRARAWVRASEHACVCSGVRDSYQCHPETRNCVVVIAASLSMLWSLLHRLVCCGHCCIA